MERVRGTCARCTHNGLVDPGSDLCRPCTKDLSYGVNDPRTGGEYTEYAPGRYGCPDCGVEMPREGHDHEGWCRNPENPDADLSALED